MGPVEVKSIDSFQVKEPRKLTVVSERRPRPVRVRTGLNLYMMRGILQYGAIVFVVISVVMGAIMTNRIAEKYGVDILLILPILLRAIGQALLFTMPVSLLFGTSLLMGRLRADRELLALSAAGLSPLQLLAPVLLLCTVMGGANYLFNQLLVPEWRFMNRNIARYLLEQLPYAGEGRNLELKLGGYSLWVERHSGRELEGFFLLSTGEGGSGPVSARVMNNVETVTYPFYLYAERAHVRSLDDETSRCSIELEGVSVFIDNELIANTDVDSDFMQRADLESWTWSLTVDEKDRNAKDCPWPLLGRHRAERWKLWQEAARKGDATTAAEARRQYFQGLHEEHRRLAGALSCLTFPLAAFAIALFTLSANRFMPFFLAATLVPPIFFTCDIIGGRFARDGYLPSLSMQLGNLILTALAAALIWRSYLGPRGGRRARRQPNSSTGEKREKRS